MLWLELAGQIVQRFLFNVAGADHPRATIVILQEFGGMPSDAPPLVGNFTVFRSKTTPSIADQRRLNRQTFWQSLGILFWQSVLIAFTWGLCGCYRRAVLARWN